MTNNTKKESSKYQKLDASPVKSFFVRMLTRDIALPDAILDLIDNCVDGILRSSKKSDNKKPYEGYYAKINLDKDSFSIEDNCGGIPWEIHDYAFRMGRPEGKGMDSLQTVGVYGIGMKRAIFKMGKSCKIITQHKDDSYMVEITPEWISKEDEWRIPVKEMGKGKFKSDGTKIFIKDLHENVSETFGRNRDSFESDFNKRVATHYAFIIEKGFNVILNGTKVKPRPTKLIFAENEDRAITPFIYQAEKDGVEVFLAIGFTQSIPSEEEAISENEDPKRSSIDAGWTVVCNDRAVLYSDKSEMTGWGEAGIPNYHNQFIAISGIVEFRSNDASKLPTTTTKRGIDATSTMYLQVKNKMREGMRMFIDYTNQWKKDLEESKKHIRSGEAMEFHQIKNKSTELKFSSVKKGLKGKQYKPKLPLPKPKEKKRRRVSFVKDISDIRIVGEYLFDDSEAEASLIGERCFDETLKQAKS